MKVGSKYTGGQVQRNGARDTSVDMNKGENTMAGSDRPAGMDSVPSKFNVGKVQDTSRTNMGAVAKIAHVERPDRVGSQVKGGISGDKGGGKQ